MRFQRQTDSTYPSLIDSFHQSHTRNGTFPVGGLAQQQYVSNFSYLMYEII